MTDPDRAPLEYGDLLAYFEVGEKPRADWKVGTEHEKIGVLTDGYGRIPYEGDRGIRSLLERIASRDAWKPVYEEERPIALLKDGASITLEPGGQIELSGAPLRTARETCSEFNAHVDLVKDASEDLGIAWLALGADPFHAVNAIPVMPKKRYAIMRRYLPTRGRLALQMMHATATVQANFDYADPSDMAFKLRTAMGVSPLVSALYANSSLSEGKPSGFISRRVEIWRHTDPDRCGVLPFVFEDGFDYRRYTEWALDVPMFFIVRDHDYWPAKGRSFRQFMAEGIDGHRATLEDWDLHLTTVFPEVRLKRYIEVRGADAASPAMTCALPALWKGILYDDAALSASWELVAGWSLAQREEALREVALYGLRAQVAGQPALDLARELVGIAGEGLRRIAERGETDRDERGFLDVLHAQIELGVSPGEVVLRHWEGDWQGRPERLIEYARY
ncbi:MAG: glutamate--cysteine ligase [Myxococcota bacterium]